MCWNLDSYTATWDFAMSALFPMLSGSQMELAKDRVNINIRMDGVADFFLHFISVRLWYLSSWEVFPFAGIEEESSYVGELCVVELRVASAWQSKRIWSPQSNTQQGVEPLSIPAWVSASLRDFL